MRDEIGATCSASGRIVADTETDGNGVLKALCPGCGAHVLTEALWPGGSDRAIRVHRPRRVVLVEDAA